MTKLGENFVLRIFTSVWVTIFFPPASFFHVASIPQYSHITITATPDCTYLRDSGVNQLR